VLLHVIDSDSVEAVAGAQAALLDAAPRPDWAAPPSG
jgi:hypothetical protein